MTLKSEVDTQVTSLLKNVIKDTSRSWLSYKPKNTFKKEDWLVRSIPSYDKPRSSTGIQIADKDCLDIQGAMKLLGASNCVSACYMAPNEGLGWHTNSNDVGKRVYYIFSLEPSVFIYRDSETQEIVQDWDDKGWTARTFLVSDNIRFWHNVWTSGRRFAFGFSF